MPTLRLVREFLCGSPFPWTPIEDCRPFQHVQAQGPVPSLPPSLPSPSPSSLPPLLTAEQYIRLHRRTTGSRFYISPKVILDKISPPLCQRLLCVPLAPQDFGEGYLLANGDWAPAFERNLTVPQFIKQWYLRTRLQRSDLEDGQDEHFRLKKIFRSRVSDEAANVVNWNRPNIVTRPDHPYECDGWDYDIQQVPWLEKLGVTRQEARTTRDEMYTSYHNLDANPSEVSLNFFFTTGLVSKTDG